MATLAATHPTLLDLAKRQDPDGKIATIVEQLNLTNEILDDMVWVEGNLETGHRTTMRSGIPAPTWRKLYGGVQPTKSTTVQVTDNTGMMENYSEVDVALANMSGNASAFRASEDMAIMEGMSQEMATSLLYANEATKPESFTGLVPRFNSLSAENAGNIIDAGGAGTDNGSIWLCVWGPNTLHGIIPKGSKAGLQHRDLGEVTLETAPGGGGKMQAYRSHFRWDAGLCLRDWRYVVRIANIDKSLLKADLSTGANLMDLMVQAIELIPSVSGGRAAFYMSRSMRSMMRRMQIEKVKNSTLTVESIAGKQVLSFDGIPVRRVDALAGDEARVV